MVIVVCGVAGVWKTSWHIFRNRRTINVGWMRKMTDWYQGCPGHQNSGWVPCSVLREDAFRVTSGHQWAPRCFVYCVTAFRHTHISRRVECWSKGRLSLNSISSMHTLVWTDGLTMAQDSKLIAFRNLNCERVFLEVRFLAASHLYFSLPNQTKGPNVLCWQPLWSSYVHIIGTSVLHTLAFITMFEWKEYAMLPVISFVPDS
jgi:hypothetical protein